MKRTWLLCILAVAPAALFSQVAPDRAPRAESGEPAYNYRVYAGFAYTSLNQVNQSRHGLIGVDIQVARNWGRYFALVGDGAYFSTPVGSGNPGNPSVDMILGGPELRAPLYGKVNGFIHGLLGGEHTGGEGMTPRISFAGGIGGGLEYVMSQRLLIRVGGDNILSSFSVRNNTPQLGYSPHMRGNARASIGISYRF